MKSLSALLILIAGFFAWAYLNSKPTLEPLSPEELKESLSESAQDNPQALANVFAKMVEKKEAAPSAPPAYGDYRDFLDQSVNQVLASLDQIAEEQPSRVLDAIEYVLQRSPAGNFTDRAAALGFAMRLEDKKAEISRLALKELLDAPQDAPTQERKDELRNYLTLVNSVFLEMAPNKERALYDLREAASKQAHPEVREALVMQLLARHPEMRESIEREFPTSEFRLPASTLQGDESHPAPETHPSHDEAEL